MHCENGCFASLAAHCDIIGPRMTVQCEHGCAMCIARLVMQGEINCRKMIEQCENGCTMLAWLCGASLIYKNCCELRELHIVHYKIGTLQEWLCIIRMVVNYTVRMVVWVEHG